MFKSANGEQVDAKEDTSTVEAKQEEINVTVLPDIARIFNGQYHEVNPGQYHEVTKILETEGVFHTIHYY